ncbi:MAG TPA: serine/threonine-protein kinase [Kofleriaceae bacterium]|nr:serine/threonine-protein kinase [Kofleriaceae bacterium]
MAGPAPRETRWRTLVDLALARPATDTLEAHRVNAYWSLVRLIALTAVVFDVGLWFALRDTAGLSAGAIDAFVGINIPLLGCLALLGHTQRERATPSPLPVAIAVVLAQATVVVWIEVTGSLSSYFLVAGAMLIVVQRAFLSWTMGVVSLVTVLAMHGGAFALEELGVLGRAPLFRDGAGPLYATASMRWSVMSSIASVYGMTWLGANVLIAAMRRTERALASAERRLAAVAEVAREGRLTGKRVAGYTLLEVVGRGGMAEVYRAVPTGKADAEPVAIKVLHPYLVEDATVLQRARREASLAGRLPSSVTAAVREVLLNGPGERIVVLDYLDGEDLAALLRRRTRVPALEAIPLLEAICKAVAAVHAAGITHRDLKPHNLFVLRDGTIRVLDFGIARADDDAALTQASAILGTPGYMAPEAVQHGAAIAGPAADVYALGVIAYQLLTGERPLPVSRDASTPAVEPIPPSKRVPELPHDLDVVIALALARDPRHRYTSAAELAEDLVSALDGELSVRTRKRAASAGSMLDDTLVAEPSSG